MINIPQFDILSLGAQIYGLLFSFLLFYYFNIKITIPSYIESKKFRNKKINTNHNFVDIITNSFNNNIFKNNINYIKYV